MGDGRWMMDDGRWCSMFHFQWVFIRLCGSLRTSAFFAFKSEDLNAKGAMVRRRR